MADAADDRDNVSDRPHRPAANDELIDRITIAGHGAHPPSGVRGVVERLCAARDLVAPAIPIAVLSNSTTCMYADVRGGLSRLDERYMKLDGGDPFTLRNINGTRVAIDAIVEGLLSECSIPDATRRRWRKEPGLMAFLRSL